jgi:hypothetical protein
MFLRYWLEDTFAIINPIPLVPPVTKATLPLTENKVLISVEAILRDFNNTIL